MNQAFFGNGATPASPVQRQRRPVTPWRRLWRRVDHWIMLTHRWIGIFACLICLVWCLSGIALIYIVEPKVMDAEYRASLNPIEFSQVRVDPTAALRASAITGFPSQMRLEMLGGRPVYFVTDWKGTQSAVFGDTGEKITKTDAARALAIARDYTHSNRPTYIKLVDSDRWTFKRSFDGAAAGINADALRPYHLVALHDDADRQIYISARTGAVPMDTSAHDRFWSWFARVPHLIELPVERSVAGPWRQFFLWSTALSTALAVLGIVLGLLRLSPSRRYPEQRITPFRGWMLWHQILGLIGGTALFAWAATAWIYMHPGQWLSPGAESTATMQRYAGHNAADFPLSAMRLGQIAPPGAIYTGFSWLAGKPLAYFGFRDGHIASFDGATGEPVTLSPQTLVNAAKRIVPDAPVTHAELRTSPDRYWHSFKGDVRKLPMFRVEFADAKRTWLHLDPATGELMQTKTAADRTYFLFFNEIHKFDFYSFKEPYRQIVVWILMLLATAISVTGVVIGWKHLVRMRLIRGARANTAYSAQHQRLPAS